MDNWKLPDGWHWIALGDEHIAEIIMGQSPPGNTYNTTGNGLPFYQGKADFGELYPAPRQWCSEPKKIAEQGDVLISVRAPVGPTNLCNERSAIGRGLSIIRPKNTDTRYLLYALRALEPDISKMGQGSTFAAINKQDLVNIKIPIPFPENSIQSLETQRRIVLRLETLLGEIKSAQELQENIQEETNLLIDSVLSETFSNRDGWQNMKSLGELVTINAPLVDPREPDFANLPHIYGASIESGTGRLLEYHTAAEDGMKSSKYLFEPGVVLYSKIRPYLRKVTIANFRGVCSADMYPLTLTSEELSPEFLMWTLLSPEFTEFINGYSLRARIPKVNREQLMAYRVRYPDINSQKKITAYIQNWCEEVSEMRRAQNENAELLAQTEQSFLLQAFRGEL